MNYFIRYKDRGGGVSIWETLEDCSMEREIYWKRRGVQEPSENKWLKFNCDATGSWDSVDVLTKEEVFLEMI